MNWPRAKISALILLLAFALASCESIPIDPLVSGGPNAALRFIDWSSFDQELSNSLSAPLPQVEVAFYDRVSPSAMPDRLQKWLMSVQTGGGSVKVVQPSPTVSVKNPLLLVSAIQSLWSATKMVKGVFAQSQFKSAQHFNAEIILKPDDKGESVIDKVVFVRK